LQETEKVITKLLQKPLDFSSNESIIIWEGDSLRFAANEQAFYEKWYKWLKYQA
jgi:hypothetical protein